MVFPNNCIDLESFALDDAGKVCIVFGCVAVPSALGMFHAIGEERRGYQCQWALLARLVESASLFEETLKWLRVMQ